jgi:tetratricopeptide (TPR) repeat protein
MLQAALELERAGRFKDAFQAIEIARLAPGDHVTAEVLKAELLQVLGRLPEARARATALLRKSDRVSNQHRSACEAILGYVAREQANIDDAIEHFQRSLSLARSARDLKRVCRTQTALIAILTDRYGPDAATPMIAELRTNAIKLGDPHTFAALHLFVGESEGKRGLLKRASRHATLAMRILGESPNDWLESMAENLSLAICLMRSELKAALPHGLKAVELAQRSGSAIMCRASLGNLGNLYYFLGDFEKAIEFFEKGVSCLPSDGDTKNWSLESRARVRLAQERFLDCEILLNEIEQSIKCDEDRRLFAHRYAAMARVLLLARQGRLEDALVQVENVLALTHVTGDRLLGKHALLTKADISRQLGRADQFRSIIDEFVTENDIETPETFAQYESTLAAACLAERGLSEATTHYQRALRICRSISNVPLEIDVKASWNRIDIDQSINVTTDTLEDRRNLAGAVLQSFWSLLANASQPEVTARELFAIVKSCSAASRMTLYLRHQDGQVEFLDTFQDPESSELKFNDRTFSIGTVSDGNIELTVQPNGKTHSIATINAISRVLTAIQELQQARSERQERAPLWPPDDPNVTADGAVVSGRMREVMTFAQRVARANVSVLITGVIDRQQQLDLAGNREYPSNIPVPLALRPGRKGLALRSVPRAA